MKSRSSSEQAHIASKTRPLVQILEKSCVYSREHSFELNLIKLFQNVNSYKIWLVGCFGFNGPLRQYFSLYRAVSQREGERKEKR